MNSTTTINMIKDVKFRKWIINATVRKSIYVFTKMTVRSTLSLKNILLSSLISLIKKRKVTGWWKIDQSGIVTTFAVVSLVKSIQRERNLN